MTFCIYVSIKPIDWSKQHLFIHCPLFIFVRIFSNASRDATFVDLAKPTSESKFYSHFVTYASGLMTNLDLGKRLFYVAITTS